MTLRPAGTGYRGTAKAQVTACTVGQQEIPETDTITLTLAPVKGNVRNGAWATWAGTMEMSAPYLSKGDEYCPSASWTFAVTSG
jgi:hypothetical protein